MLLATREVDPNSKDIRGRTPLSYAAQRHSSNAIQMLLLTEKVDPDSRDNDGMSPLSDAMAWNLPFRMLSDLAGTFRLLWNTGKTDAKARNNAGDTAIDAAHKALERVKHDDTKDIIKSCIKVMESYQTPEEVGYLGDRWWESLNELEDPRMRRSSTEEDEGAGGGDDLSSMTYIDTTELTPALEASYS
ncbi:hypothetical protein F5B20DRAFT_584241 [Whalleya microplaca]|nr:hypothetical protein F5B20DRAFT_584241 [Whalleya microplaca]